MIIFVALCAIAAAILCKIALSLLDQPTAHDDLFGSLNIDNGTETLIARSDDNSSKGAS